MDRKKGISDLISVVLLIAFVMAIAGIILFWSRTFSEDKLYVADNDVDCLGAIDMSRLSFDNGTILVTITDASDRINLTGILVSVEYNDPAKNVYDIKISDYNASDPLAPGEFTTLVMNTGDPEKPRRLEVVSSNCRKHSAVLDF